MGIDFNTFASQDTQQLTVKKRYNASGKEVATGVSYIFMDTIKQYIDEGYLVDNNADGQDNVFSAADKKNLYNKFVEIHQNHNYSTDFKRMHSGDSFTYSKDEIFALAEAAGYVVKPSQSENKSTDEPVKDEVTQPEVIAEAPEQEADVIPDVNIDEASTNNPFIIETLNSDPEIQNLNDGKFIIDFKGYTIENGETGEILDMDYDAEITQQEAETDEEQQTKSEKKAAKAEKKAAEKAERQDRRALTKAAKKIAKEELCPQYDGRYVYDIEIHIEDGSNITAIIFENKETGETYEHIYSNDDLLNKYRSDNGISSED